MRKRKIFSMGISAAALAAALAVSPHSALCAEAKENSESNNGTEDSAVSYEGEEYSAVDVNELEPILDWGNNSSRLSGNTFTLVLTDSNDINMDQMYVGLKEDTENVSVYNGSDDSAREDIVTAVHVVFPDLIAHAETWMPDSIYERTDDWKKEDDQTYTFTWKSIDGTNSEKITVKLKAEDCCTHMDYSEWDYDYFEHWLVCAQCGEKMPRWSSNRYTDDHGPYSKVKRIEYEYDLIDETGVTNTYDNHTYVRTCAVCGGKKMEMGKNIVATDAEVRDIIDENIEEIKEGYYEVHGYPDNIASSYTYNPAYQTQEEAEQPTGSSSSPNGSWASDATGWWFVKTDGSYPVSSWFECASAKGSGWYHFNSAGYMDHGLFTDTDGNTYYLHDIEDGNYGAMLTGWQWIDGNGDGLKECYYFNQTSGENGLPLGAMLKNATTPDGYTVNANGEWVVNGVVQTR